MKKFLKCIMMIAVVIVTILESGASINVLAADRGSYQVSGLGARKQAILNAGGNTLDLAIAMLETENMQANYTYGDGKTGDAANFGIFKQNWFMIRHSVSEYKSCTASQYSWADVLNSNLSWDIKCLHTCQNYYGLSKWFGGHRNGETGLNNYNTTDINNYKNAVYWIKSQIDSNSNYKTDNTCFWVSVPAI